LVSWKIWERRKTPIDVKIIARVFRQRDDKLQGYVLPIREETSQRNFDLLSKIEINALKNIGVFGTGGSGKSKMLSWLAWQYSNPDEVSKYHTLEEIKQYDKKGEVKIRKEWRPLEPVKVFAFNYHRFQEGKGDFEGLDFEHVDIFTRLPNLFDPQYHEDLIQSFSVVFVSEIKSTGLMASMLQDSFRDILEYKKCESWEDFRKNAESVAKNSTGLTQEVASIVAKKVRTLNVGVVAEIDFQFDKSMILDFAHLPNDLAKNLYSEFYARVIHNKAEDASVAGKPHSIMLMVDESKRLLKYGDISILAIALANARKHMRICIATQNVEDVNSGSFHFQWLQFKTSNGFDLDRIKKVDEMHWEAVKKLNEKEFVWVNEDSTQIPPILKLDITRMEEFRVEHPQAYENIEEKELGNFTTSGQEHSNEKYAYATHYNKAGGSQTPPTQAVVKPKYDKEKTAKDIVNAVEASPTGLFISQVLEQVGYPNRKDGNRGTAYKLIKKMAEPNGAIRIKDYISAEKPSEHKLVFDKNNPQRAETQVHKRLRDDTKTLLDENKISYTEGLQNQGYDFETLSVWIEVESGLKHSINEWNIKILKSEKMVITILCNEEDRKKYSILPCTEAGKTKLVLLSELLETLRNLKN